MEFVVEKVHDLEGRLQGEAGYLPGASVPVMTMLSGNWILMPSYLRKFIVYSF